MLEKLSASHVLAVDRCDDATMQRCSVLNEAISDLQPVHCNWRSPKQVYDPLALDKRTS